MHCVRLSTTAVAKGKKNPKMCIINISRVGDLKKKMFRKSEMTYLSSISVYFLIILLD